MKWDNIYESKCYEKKKMSQKNTCLYYTGKYLKSQFFNISQLTMGYDYTNYLLFLVLKFTHDSLYSPYIPKILNRRLHLCCSSVIIFHGFTSCFSRLFLRLATFFLTIALLNNCFIPTCLSNGNEFSMSLLEWVFCMPVSLGPFSFRLL